MGLICEWFRQLGLSPVEPVESHRTAKLIPKERSRKWHPRHCSPFLSFLSWTKDNEYKILASCCCTFRTSVFIGKVVKRSTVNLHKCNDHLVFFGFMAVFKMQHATRIYFQEKHSLANLFSGCNILSCLTLLHLENENLRNKVYDERTQYVKPQSRPKSQDPIQMDVRATPWIRT